MRRIKFCPQAIHLESLTTALSTNETQFDAISAQNGHEESDYDNLTELLAEHTSIETSIKQTAEKTNAMKLDIKRLELQLAPLFIIQSSNALHVSHSTPTNKPHAQDVQSAHRPYASHHYHTDAEYFPPPTLSANQRTLLTPTEEADRYLATQADKNHVYFEAPFTDIKDARPEDYELTVKRAVSFKILSR